MRRFVMAALVGLAAMTVSVPAMAQYQSGGAWNGPRGSGYYYQNYGNGGWNGRDVGNTLLGAAALISVLRPPVVVAAPPPVPVYVVSQPQVTMAPMIANQPPVALVPQGSYVTNRPIIQSAEFPDPSTGLMCRMYPGPGGGQKKMCQMPSGQWAQVR